VGRLIISNSMTINGAFEAPVPVPDGWLVLDADSQHASLQTWRAADAMVLGRKTYEGLAAAWPQLAHVPGYEAFADQMNSMPKYVASRTLREPLEWNATLLQGHLATSVTNLKDEHHGNLIVSGGGELAHALISQGLVDEVWFTVRAFDAPSALLYRMLPGLIRRRRRELFTRYLRAISPLYTTPA